MADLLLPLPISDEGLPRLPFVLRTLGFIVDETDWGGGEGVLHVQSVALGTGHLIPLARPVHSTRVGSVWTIDSFRSGSRTLDNHYALSARAAHTSGFVLECAFNIANRLLVPMRVTDQVVSELRSDADAVHDRGGISPPSLSLRCTSPSFSPLLLSSSCIAPSEGSPMRPDSRDRLSSIASRDAFLRAIRVWVPPMLLSASRGHASAESTRLSVLLFELRDRGWWRKDLGRFMLLVHDPDRVLDGPTSYALLDGSPSSSPRLKSRVDEVIAKGIAQLLPDSIEERIQLARSWANPS